MFNQGTTEIFLTGTEHEDMGEIGLAFDGCQFPFFTGTLGAHDLIEHVNGVSNIGSVTDELQATGAAHYTRVQNGYNVTEDGLVNDLITSAVESVNSAEFGPTIPQQPESDNDESYEWIIEQFRENITAELNDDQMEEFDIDHYCDQALQAMRLGESKQAERFETPWQACEVFQLVEDAINKHFGVSKDYSHDAKMSFECYEGQEFVLTVVKDDDHGTRVFFDEYYEIDDDLCPECQSCVLEDGECEDCNEED